MDVIYQGNMGFDSYKREQRFFNRRRSERTRLFKKMVLFTVTLVIVLGALIFFGNSVKDRAMASEEQVYEYYTSVTIMPGDTLWSIADKYSYGSLDDIDVRVEELVELNNLGSTDIHAGEKIVVKYYSPEKL
ncbi:MAG: LysM peptidoglycan-binding domain-containing protein [Lachnospiraceae bacterium]|nr:LysM peptidoglycan-binding domain-containing protein [Lachnospiraceae bacterium]